MVAVDYRPVAYRDAAAYHAALRGGAAHVDYDPVLHGTLLAYDYGLGVAPYDRARANIAARAYLHVPDYGCGVAHVGAGIYPRTF